MQEHLGGIVMNIAIIGCGYVGTAVARLWRSAGYTVTATTTREERVAELEKVAQRVVVARGDDKDALKSAAENQDVVLLSVGAANGKVYRETYVGTAKNLVEVLKQTPSVRHLLYTGTYSVYGDRNGEPVSEETPVAPVNENGEILCETERVLLGAAGENLRVCILRLGGIYGAGRELAKIFGRVAGTTRPGAGDDISNWIHLDDIVGTLEFARLNQLQGIYNLVNDTPLTRRELLDRLCARHGWEKVSWNPSEKQVFPYNALVSNQKIKGAGYQLIYPETML